MATIDEQLNAYLATQGVAGNAFVMRPIAAAWLAGYAAGLDHGATIADAAMANALEAMRPEAARPWPPSPGGSTYPVHAFAPQSHSDLCKHCRQPEHMHSHREPYAYDEHTDDLRGDADR